MPCCLSSPVAALTSARVAGMAVTRTPSRSGGDPPRHQRFRGLLSRFFMQEVGIESHAGFGVGLELEAKARGRRSPVAVLPTVWLECTGGLPNFKLRRWIPYDLRWYA